LRVWDLSRGFGMIERMFGTMMNDPGTADLDVGAVLEDPAERVDHLVNMPPGVELAWALARIDRTQLNGHQLVTVLKARQRQIAHDHAHLYADMAEIAHCDQPGPDAPAHRTVAPVDGAADELRPAMVWTRRAAESQMALAVDLAERVPQVLRHLRVGRIDLTRARVLVDDTSHLAADDARRVITEIIDEAAGLTTGQLRALLKRRCAVADTDDAAKRYQRGIEDRRLVAQPNPDGTGDLYGLNLPPDRVMAIRRRIDRLARHLRRNGEARTMDQLRADVYLDLLDGTTVDDSATGEAPVTLTVDLATLLDLDDTPGEIPGWGPVIADIARTIVDRQHDSEWRVHVTDPDTGQVIADGTTRRRPTTALRRTVEAHHRTCLFPGCRTPASDCDLDHRIPWTHGGPTTRHNLAPLCRHDHTAKHQRRWTLTSQGAGWYTWTSPLGHTYMVTTQQPP
jgi:hypothetical protein